MRWDRIDAYQIVTTPDFIHFHLDEIGGNYFIQMPGARSDEINLSEITKKIHPIKVGLIILL